MCGFSGRQGGDRGKKRAVRRTRWGRGRVGPLRGSNFRGRGRGGQANVLMHKTKLSGKV